MMLDRSSRMNVYLHIRMRDVAAHPHRSLCARSTRPCRVDNATLKETWHIDTALPYRHKCSPSEEGGKKVFFLWDPDKIMETFPLPSPLGLSQRKFDRQ